MKILQFLKSKNFIFSYCFATLLVFIEIVLCALLAYSLLRVKSIFSCSVVIANIVIILTNFIFTIICFSRTIRLEIVTQDLEQEKLYNKTLSLLYDNIRGFKHDFSNIIQSIGGYISTNNIESLKNYYNSLLEDCQMVNNLSILSPEIINNPAVLSLLTSKYYKSEELGIKVNLEIFLDLQNLNTNIYEFTRILGILLDNAIEAASLSVEKNINIVFRRDIKSKKDLFIIENTYSNKDVNIEEIFEKGITSKKNEKDIKNHGLGLWEVRKFISKTNNLNLYTTKNDEFFKQQLEVYDY